MQFGHLTAGAERVLVVGVEWNSAGQAIVRTVTGVTYNGVAMTQAIHRGYGYLGSDLWYLVAPALGNNYVEVTFSGEVDLAVCGSVSVTGANQSSPISNTNWAEGTSLAPNVNIGSDSGELVVDSLAVAANVTATPDAGQTQRWHNSPGSQLRGAGSTEPGASPYVAMGWALSLSNQWVTVGLSIAAYLPVEASRVVRYESVQPVDQSPVILYESLGTLAEQTFAVLYEAGGPADRYAPSDGAGRVVRDPSGSASGRG